MKKYSLAAVFILVASWASGCVVVHSEKTHAPARTTVPAAPATPEPEDVTVREIDAVGKLAFNDSRHQAYKQIAARPGLSDGAQVHLVEAVFSRLVFDDAKVDVLRTLVCNPSFSPGAKAAILERLDRLAFEDHRRKVLDAMNEKSSSL
jgi:hypothetical protein